MQNQTDDGLLGADDRIAPSTSTVDMAEGCVNEYDYYESTEKWLLGEDPFDEFIAPFHFQE